MITDPSPQQTRLSTLVLIRWLALGGQTITLGVVQAAVAPLDWMPVVATVAAGAALNFGLALAPGSFRRLDEGRAARHLAFDIGQLAVLIGLTGGLANPFSLFLLAPVTVAAAILSARRTMGLAALAMVAASVMAKWHQPLPWPAPGLVPPPLAIFALWVALQVGIVSVAFFTWRMAEESRSIAAAYAQTRLALAQERRVAEIGALAAAIAHELNTPLATICLLAHDMAADIPSGDRLDADMRLLIGQAQRCRDSLARLTHGRDRDKAVDAERVAFPSLVEMAATAHAEDGTMTVLFDHDSADLSPAPWIERSPEILHGLGNFIQNARQFAASRVEITTWWSQTGRGVRIRDDGPGFPGRLLERLGEPYLSARTDQDSSHLGLGIFIALTLLARTGATVAFANGPEGGAEILVEWRGMP